jgi:hypothetical protein
MTASDSNDRLAGYKLLETGVLVAFEITETHFEPSPNGGFARVAVQLGEVDEDGERSEDHEWGALGFIFCIASLSFHDARPRGVSGMDFADRDELTVADLHDGLRFSKAGLRFSADYIRGRCVKTDITVSPNGSATIETRNRGESAFRWVERLKGKTHLRTVAPTPDPTRPT